LFLAPKASRWGRVSLINPPSFAEKLSLGVVVVLSRNLSLISATQPQKDRFATISSARNQQDTFVAGKQWVDDCERFSQYTFTIDQYRCSPIYKNVKDALFAIHLIFIYLVYFRITWRFVV